MIIAEKHRLKHGSNTIVEKHIQVYVKRLESELKDLKKELKDSIRQNPKFVEKVKLYKSMPGVGDNLSYNLVANLGELGHLN